MKLPPATAWATRTQTLSVLTGTTSPPATTTVASAGYAFNPATGNTVTINFTATSARYVRINVTGNTGWPAAQISEFEVYGHERHHRHRRPVRAVEPGLHPARRAVRSV